MGFSPVPAPAGMRTKLPVDAGTFLQGFDSFVLLHLYFFGGEFSLELSGIINTGTFGSGGNPRQGGKQGAPAPGIVSWDREENSQGIARPLFCAKKRQILRSCIRKCPCVSMTRQKSPARTQRCLL